MVKVSNVVQNPDKKSGFQIPFWMTTVPKIKLSQLFNVFGLKSLVLRHLWNKVVFFGAIRKPNLSAIFVKIKLGFWKFLDFECLVFGSQM